MFLGHLSGGALFHAQTTKTIHLTQDDTIVSKATPFMSQIANGNGIDWFDGAVQVKLRLTENPDVLQARKRDKTTWQVKNGRGELVLRNDSREYRFAPGVEMNVPAPVAAGLIHASTATVGDQPLTDDYSPALEIVSHWNLGQPEPGRNQRPQCPVCPEQFDTAHLLAAHIIDEHAEVAA